MSISNTVKNQLMDFIRALPAIQTVYGHEEMAPTGWPAIFVQAGDMDGEFIDNAHNSRIYGFKMICVFPTGQDFVKDPTVNREEFAEQTIATVLDEIINALDTNFVLEGTPVLYSNAADMIWGTANLDNGVCKAAQISLRIYTEYQIR